MLKRGKNVPDIQMKIGGGEVTSPVFWSCTCHLPTNAHKCHLPTNASLVRNAVTRADFDQLTTHKIA